MTGNRGYWEKRFLDEGLIWGEIPSKSAFQALEIFRCRNVKTVLVPGSGYGRNTKLFSLSGFEVSGIEISEHACALAKQFDPETNVICGSVLDMPSGSARYDAVYCFNVLHLFRQDDRNTFLEQCRDHCKEDGLLYFTAFSDEEPNFGKGSEVEYNTFETKPGRPAHYYTEDDWQAQFTGFGIIETGMLYDPEDHGGEPHTHALCYILAENSRHGTEKK